MAVILAFLLMVLVLLPFLLLGGFIWMICLGALAHIFSNPHLAIDYKHSILVALIAGFLLSGLRSTRKSD